MIDAVSGSSDWASAGALGVAIVSIFFTWRALRIQSRHNKLSVKPIPFLALAKEGGISARIENHGFGPLRFTKFEIRKAGSLVSNIVELIPDPKPDGIAITFNTGIWDRSLKEGDGFYLFKIDFTGPSHDALSYLNQCKVNMIECEVIIGYTDIYETKNADYVKSLSWLASDILK